MTIGTLIIQIYIPGCRSLKEKRAVMRRLTAQIRNEFNVSVSEVDKQEMHQSAEIGVAIVSNDRAFANAVLSKIVNKVERETTCHLQDYSLEFR